MVMRTLLLGLGLSVLPACAAIPLHITPSGFHNDELKYEVLFQPRTQRLLPDDWRLDNFYGSEGSLKPKEASRYVSPIRLDLNGDGIAEYERKFPDYELRFEHRRTNGVIMLRALVMSEYEQDKDLHLLTDDIVSSLTGGYEFPIHDDFFKRGDLRLATRIVSAGPAKVAGQEAFAVVFDVVNVDQSLISAPAVIRKAKLVLIRSGLSLHSSRYKPDDAFPVYLCAQYLEHPEQFENQLPAFMQLLKQIRIADRNGYEESLAPVVPTSLTTQRDATAAEPSPRNSSQ